MEGGGELGEVGSRAEPIVPKNLPIILFQISTSFSPLFQSTLLFRMRSDKAWASEHQIQISWNLTILH